MKHSRFSEEQIVYAIRQAESGTPIGDVCRQLGVSEATVYAWKKKYAHLGVSELRRLRQLGGRKQPVETTGGRSLPRQTHVVRGLTKKNLRPARRRALAQWLQARFSVSCAGLSAGPVWAGVVVSEESGQGSDGSPASHSPLGASSTAVWLPADLGLTPAGRLAGQPQASPSMVSPRRAPVADARAATQASGTPPRTCSDPDQPNRTLEYGFRT